MVEYHVAPPVTSEELNDLFVRVWDGHERRDLTSVIRHSLTYVCAYDEGRLVGYVNVAWDGGEHAFLLDTAVDRDRRREGIGRSLVGMAVEEARRRGMKWLHVDFEPHLEQFYRAAGFRHTAAGLIRLSD